MQRLTVGYVGNFEPHHSTENEIRKALYACGHQVLTFQENDTSAWVQLIEASPDLDLVLWTRTHGHQMSHELQAETADVLHRLGVPLIGYHLDIWWGLPRERQIREEPYFQLVDVMCTADGGHDDQWEQAGITHWWFPPAVSEAECFPGVARDYFAADLGFTGTWDGSYHPEWPHRQDLVAFVQNRGGRCWPEVGCPAVRGDDLCDLYASVKVMVGDSCGNVPRYLSDRIPETLGRAGFLIHPRTEGVTDGTLYVDGIHLRCFDAGDWDGLGHLIDHYTKPENEPERRRIAEHGREHVLERHTYTVRMRQLVETLAQHELLLVAA